MRFLRWLAGFVEAKTPQSSTRLIALASFVVGAVLAFKHYPVALVAIFVVQLTGALLLRTMGQDSIPDPPPDTGAP